MEDGVGQLIKRLDAELLRIATRAGDARMLEKVAARDLFAGEQLLGNLILFMQTRVASLAVTPELFDCVRALAYELSHRFDVYELSEALESQLHAAWDAVQRGGGDDGQVRNGSDQARDQDHYQGQGRGQAVQRDRARDAGNEISVAAELEDSTNHEEQGEEATSSSSLSSSYDDNDEGKEEEGEERERQQPHRSISSHEGGQEPNHVMLRVESEHEEEDVSAMRELVAATDDVFPRRRDLAKVRPINDVMVSSGSHHQLPAITVVVSDAATSCITINTSGASPGGHSDLSDSTKEFLESVERGDVPHWWTTNESDLLQHNTLYELSAQQTTNVFHKLVSIQSQLPAWTAVLCRLSLAIFDAVESGRDELFHLLDEVLPVLSHIVPNDRALHDCRLVELVNPGVREVGRLLNQGLRKSLPGYIKQGSMLDRMEVSGIAPSTIAIESC